MKYESPVRNEKTKKRAAELYIKDGKVLRSDTHCKPGQVRHVCGGAMWGKVLRVRPCGLLVDVEWPDGAVTTQRVRLLRWSKKEEPKRMRVKKTEKVYRTDGKIPGKPIKDE